MKEYYKGYTKAIETLEKKIDDSIKENHGALNVAKSIDLLNDIIKHVHAEKIALSMLAESENAWGQPEPEQPEYSIVIVKGGVSI